MTWRISVADTARPAIRSLDPSLKEELIAQVDAMAEMPSAFLVRANDAEFPEGTWLYTYKSEIVIGLRISLYFVGLNDDPPRLELVGIAHGIDETT